MRTTRFILIAFLSLSVVYSCEKKVADELNSPGGNAAALQLLEFAIEAHGGYDKLESAATWKAEVRRFQGASSYVLTQYYRPGMVRLESDLGDGKFSADVIGHPHCWGSSAPVSFSCSAETRENDRPRVIMEMASQLWTMKGADWKLLRATDVLNDGKQYKQLSAHYIPLATDIRMYIDSDTNLLHSIEVEGVKAGVSGIHKHLYSQFKKNCGVLMPFHNIKSFNGDVWVAEDILGLECIPMSEELFVQPEQVEEGYFLEETPAPLTLMCAQNDGVSFPESDAREQFTDDLEANNVSMEGFVLEQISEDGRVRLCAPVDVNANARLPGFQITPGNQVKILSVFTLNQDETSNRMTIEQLLTELETRGHKPVWPIRILRYDNDGMGKIVEVVSKMSIGIE
ncbi:MAG: hypothetical protein GY732_19455 [Gammaproteobacteria bacterium]|nr:hypothetical protein [Gammaproteobacteria bacterium]